MSAPRFGPHPAEELVERYAMGCLEAAALAPFEEHLLVCPSCQDRLAETDEFIAATRQAAAALLAQSQTTPESRWRRLLPSWPLPKPAWVPALAGVLLLVLVLAATWVARHSASVPPVAVFLESVRAPAAGGVPAPAGKPLRVQLDATGLPQLPAYRLEVADRAGRAVFQAPLAPSAGQLWLTLPKLATGTYWVRLYTPQPQRELLREFGLQVR